MNCPACDSHERTTLIAAGHLQSGFAVFRCCQCGTAYFEANAWVLREDYWTAGDQQALYERPDVAAQRRERVRRRLLLVERYAPVGALLDVGCGRGAFMAAARARGWRVSGIEPSATVRPIEAGLDPLIVRGKLEDACMSPEAVDGVTMWDVLEHLDDPHAGLRAVVAMLRPGGIAAIETPNEDGLFKCIGRAALRVGVTALADYVYYLPHRVSFTLRGLEILGRRVGLEIAHASTSCTDWAFARAKLACHHGSGVATSCVASALPIVASVARMVDKGNKLVVVFRKTP